MVFLNPKDEFSEGTASGCSYQPQHFGFQISPHIEMIGGKFKLKIYLVFRVLSYLISVHLVYLEPPSIVFYLLKAKLVVFPKCIFFAVSRYKGFSYS